MGPNFGPAKSDFIFLFKPLFSECSVNDNNYHYYYIVMEYYRLKFKGTSGYCLLSQSQEHLGIQESFTGLYLKESEVNRDDAQRKEAIFVVE